MKRIVLLLACLAIMPSAVQAGELFRWVDKSGKVYYGDIPPAGDPDVERLKLSSESAQSEDLPYETLRAKQNFPVTLYVGNGCGEPCNMARSMLTKRGIPFSEKLLKYKEDAEAFKKLSGFDAVPALAVGKNFLRGFQAEQWHSELDIAGYPKTSTYRQSTVTPAPASLIAPSAPSAPITPPVPPVPAAPENQSADEQTAPEEPATQ
jgi:glutaredoxin